MRITKPEITAQDGRDAHPRSGTGVLTPLQNHAVSLLDRVHDPGGDYTLVQRTTVVISISTTSPPLAEAYDAASESEETHVLSTNDFNALQSPPTGLPATRKMPDPHIPPDLPSPAPSTVHDRAWISVGDGNPDEQNFGTPIHLHTAEAEALMGYPTTDYTANSQLAELSRLKAINSRDIVVINRFMATHRARSGTQVPVNITTEMEQHGTISSAATKEAAALASPGWVQLQVRSDRKYKARGPAADFACSTSLSLHSSRRRVLVDPAQLQQCERQAMYSSRRRVRVDPAPLQNCKRINTRQEWNHNVSALRVSSVWVFSGHTARSPC